MVDPNRKINRLTEDDVEFLNECEELFANRFSEDDEEFMARCAGPVLDPPVLTNFFTSGGGGSSSPGQQSRNRFGDKNFRGGRGNRGYNRFNRRGGGGFDSGGGGPYRNRENYRSHRNDFNRNDPPPRYSGMNVRRNYDNFVAASDNRSGVSSSRDHLPTTDGSV